MALKRSVDGLRQNAQRKRQEAFEKVERGIQKLIKEKKSVTFNAVAEAAEVSKAWLYKEPDIKARIEHLRGQSQGRKKQVPAKQQASDASKDALIRALKERIKKLEEENRDLRRQNEVAYGQILQLRETQRQASQLEKLNQNLIQQASNENLRSVAEAGLEAKIESLGIQINSTLRRLINEAPTEVVETAVESLIQAMQEGRVKNLSGFLNRAITDAWHPNDVYKFEQGSTSTFNEWWKLAHAQGVVVAAMQNEGVQYVMTPDDQWVPFTEIIKIYPLT